MFLIFSNFSGESFLRKSATFNLAVDDSKTLFTNKAAAPIKGVPTKEPAPNTPKSDGETLALVQALVKRFSASLVIFLPVATSLFNALMSAPVLFLTSVSINSLISFLTFAKPTFVLPAFTSPVAL